MRPKTVAGSLGGPSLGQEVEDQCEEVLVISESAARPVPLVMPKSTYRNAHLHALSRVPQNVVGARCSREEAAKAAAEDPAIIPTAS